MLNGPIEVLADPASVAARAAQIIVDAARTAIAARGRFTWVLAGGSTPKLLYALLATDPWRSQIDWPKVEVFFGDERTVGPDHADSNYHMAREALLSKVPIPQAIVRRMRGEADPTEAAIEYGRMLKSRFAEGGADLTLLGMGDDGHTASLFPGTLALEETHHRCVPNHVPQQNTWRITLSASFLNRSAQVLFLITGASKAARFKEVRDVQDPSRLPIQLIRPAPGTVTYLLDKPAASQLD